MPIGPNESAMPANTTSQKKVNQALALIDAKLSDCRYMADMMYGGDDNPYWEIILPFELTPGEKEVVIKSYIDSGWGSVVILNSSENEERPGLCGVKMHKNHQ